MALLGVACINSCEEGLSRCARRWAFCLICDHWEDSHRLYHCPQWIEPHPTRFWRDGVYDMMWHVDITKLVANKSARGGQLQRQYSMWSASQFCHFYVCWHNIAFAFAIIYSVPGACFKEKTYGMGKCIVIIFYETGPWTHCHCWMYSNIGQKLPLWLAFGIMS